MLREKYNKIKNNRVVIKYIKNTSWLFFSKIVSLFSVIFVGAWIAKYLGPDNFGLLSYSNSIVVLFMPLAMIGLNDIVIKELVSTKNKKEINLILGTSFGLKLFFGLIAMLFVFLFSNYYYDSFEIKTLVLIFSCYLFLQSFEIIDFFFQSKVESRFVVYSRIIAISISSVIKLIFIYYNYSIYYLAVAMVIEMFLIHCFSFFYFFRKYYSINQWYFKKSLALIFLKKSWPLFLSGLMYVVYLRIDQIMVKEILGNQSAGIYAVAINLSESWYFIPNIIISSLFPAIVLSKTKSVHVYHKRLINLYSILFWIAVLIAIFMNVFGHFIIEHLYGINYIESYSVLKIYIWSNVFFFFNVLSSKWLVIEGFYIHSFLRNIIGAFINISINFILLKKIGLMGAALSTLISYAFVGLFYDMIFKELRGNFKFKLKSILCLNK